MKQFKFLFTLFLFGLLSVSCGDDDNGGGNNNVDCSDSVAVNAAVSDELNAISTAATAYGNDPSNANCQALKNAYQDYIDALEDIFDCAKQAGLQNEFQQSIDAARASIDSIC
jgi:hypothetical protein